MFFSPGVGALWDSSGFRVAAGAAAAVVLRLRRLFLTMLFFLIFKQTDVAWRDDECNSIFEDDLGAVIGDYDSSPKCHYCWTNMSRSEFEVDVVLVEGEPRHSDQFLLITQLFVIMLMKHVLRQAIVLL